MTDKKSEADYCIDTLTIAASDEALWERGQHTVAFNEESFAKLTKDCENATGTSAEYYKGVPTVEITMHVDPTPAFFPEGRTPVLDAEEKKKYPPVPTPSTSM